MKSTCRHQTDLGVWDKLGRRQVWTTFQLKKVKQISFRSTSDYHNYYHTNIQYKAIELNTISLLYSFSYLNIAQWIDCSAHWDCARADNVRSAWSWRNFTRTFSLLQLLHSAAWIQTIVNFKQTYYVLWDVSFLLLLLPLKCISLMNWFGSIIVS